MVGHRGLRSARRPLSGAKDRRVRGQRHSLHLGRGHPVCTPGLSAVSARACSSRRPIRCFSRTSVWTGPSDGASPFPAPRGRHLQRDRPPVSDESSPPVIEYHAPDDSGVNRPPVWITAVGRGGFWPVAFTPHYDDHGYVRIAPGPCHGAAASRSPRTQGPPGFLLSFLLVDLFVAFFVVLYFQGRGGLRGHLRRCGRALHAVAERHPGGNPRPQTINRIYALTFFLIAISSLVDLHDLVSQVRQVRARQAVPWMLPVVGGDPPALHRSGSSTRELSRSWATQRRDRARAAASGSAQFGCLAPACVIVALGRMPFLLPLRPSWRWIRQKPSPSQRPGTGPDEHARPVVPFADDDIGALSLGHERTAAAFLLAIQGDPRSPFPSCRAWRNRASSTGTSSPSSRAPSSRLVPWSCSPRNPRSLSQNGLSGVHDGRRQGMELALPVAAPRVAIFVMVYSFSLFVLIWVRLSRLLRRLAQHPLADAFRRLPESCTATPWKLWRTVPNLTILSASVGSASRRREPREGPSESMRSRTGSTTSRRYRRSASGVNLRPIEQRASRGRRRSTRSARRAARAVAEVTAHSKTCGRTGRTPGSPWEAADARPRRTGSGDRFLAADHDAHGFSSATARSKS